MLRVEKRRHSKILGCGSCLPYAVCKSTTIDDSYTLKSDQVGVRKDICSRHVTIDSQTTSELASIASLRAMKAASKDRHEVDAIIVGTSTPDQWSPNVGCLIQRRLGMKGQPAIQIAAGSSGFLAALKVAQTFVESGDAECALVVGADVMTAVLEEDDCLGRSLYGDGAGAVIVGKSDQRCMSTVTLSTGAPNPWTLAVPVRRGGGASTVDVDRFCSPLAAPTFSASASAKELMMVALEELGMTHRELEWIVPQQTTRDQLQQLSQALEISMDRFILTYEHHKNALAASVPLALDVATADGRIRSGTWGLLLAVGECYGGAVILKL
jgi:3-oxoacyl-[acyl-carrier-protein] synthase III